MKKIWKSQKPIDIDAHFKYRCPDPKCGFDHWISLRESQTKNFKIVCDCGCVFKTKKVSRIKIVYCGIKPTKIKEQAVTVVETSKIPVDTKNSCVKLLVSYGFTKDESINLCEKAFDKNPVNSSGLLVKYILQNLEELNVNN
jgi:hypothetical protein